MKSAVHQSEQNRLQGKDETSLSEEREYLIVYLGDQMFGIPVLQIQDVFLNQNFTRIPLASKEIVGSLNLRGRVITAIDLRNMLDMPEAEVKGRMNIVVNYKEDSYSIVVDKVGDVVSLENTRLEKPPATLEEKWKNLSSGIFQIQDELMIVIDISNLIQHILKKNKLEEDTV